MTWTSKRKLPVKDHASLFLSWMSMLMVFVAVLAVAGSLALSNLVSSWNDAISGSLTIQIPTYTASGEPRPDQAKADVVSISNLLNETPGILSATPLSNEKMKELMEPWLGATEEISELPLPILMDVILISDQDFDFISLKNKLQDIVPLASIDSHRIWLAHLVDTAKSVRHMIIFVLLLLVLTTSFTVVYTTSSSLALQADVIKLLHMMGAKDLMIAIQYSFSNFLKALMGGCIGFVVALPLIWIASRLFTPLQDPVFLEASLSLKQIFLIILIPLFAALFAFVTGLVTVIKTLRKLI